MQERFRKALGNLKQALYCNAQITHTMCQNGIHISQPAFASSSIINHQFIN
jgi:hypothetical protein